MSRAKHAWQGRVLSVQPRIRLLRSFDQRSHSYLGYVLAVEGTLETESIIFVVALGKRTQEKHQLIERNSKLPDAPPLKRPSGLGRVPRERPSSAVGQDLQSEVCVVYLGV